MNRQGHEDANFFVGTEIEHSPALGQHTMFVVGIQDTEQIAWKIGEYDRKSRDQITHIYFGANQSFPNPDTNDAETWQRWESMIQHFLDRGYWCSLDFDVRAVEGLCEGGLIEHSQFIPVISVKLPYIKLLGYNATVKLDDRDFDATNPGVWCHSLHDLLDRNKFTTWSQYTKDKLV
jgi:hypothetical protein